MAQKKEGMKVVAENRKARHEYHILECWEAGISLTGTEVKSLRRGKASLQDAFGRIEDGEAFVYQMHISTYEEGNRFNHEPKRVRKLLLHKQEISKIFSQLREKGLTLIPLKIYFTRGMAKVEIALARGKKLYDKREDLAQKDAKREVERALKERQRG